MDDIHPIARSLAQPLPHDLREDDTFILTTERIIDDLSASLRRENVRLISKDVACSSAIQELLEAWNSAAGPIQQGDRIGPIGDMPIAKATFIASLLLPLHNAPIQTIRPGTQDSKPIPHILLDWLNDHHWPFRNEVEEVMTFKPNPTAHERFWDTLFSLCLHGDFEGAWQLVDAADFSYAVTAMDDGAERPGYHGTQLGNTQKVITRCLKLLEASPGLHRDDWNIKSADWTTFRKRVSQAVTDLEDFAEGDSADRFADDGLDLRGSRLGLSLSQRSRRAESKVPWTVYQNLKYLYGQLMGTRSELIAASADWVEAALSTVIWWDGDDDDTAGENLAASRRTKRSPRSERLVDTQPQEAYLQKIAAVVRGFLTPPETEEDADLQVNPTDHMEVALACALCGDIEGLVNIVRGWSPVISTAVVELADISGWLGSESPSLDAAGNGFDESDLMVLSYGGRQTHSITRDEVLLQYADLLAKRQRIQGDVPSSGFEGWQLAIQVLRRANDERTSAQRISKLLDRLDFSDTTQMQFTARLCDKLDLQEEAQHLSLRYADHLTSTTHQYGQAINHYVRAGAAKKITDIFQLLISLSLVQSRAYPPASDLDEDLRELCNSPKQTLAGFHRLDPAAGEALLTHLSGYATLRTFYDLRDQDVNATIMSKSDTKANTDSEASLNKPIAGTQTQTKSQPQILPLRPLARKHRAADALLALIRSASDPIHGGLYDASITSAIPTECLLSLLGEALAFVNQPTSVLNSAHITALLKAVDDVETAPSSVYKLSEACLKACLASYRGDDSVGKSTPDLAVSSATLGFSLIGSGELNGTGTGTTNSKESEGSGVLVDSNGSVNGNGNSNNDGSSTELKDGGNKVQRGWDWRRGFGDDDDVKGETVIRILRLQLAREMAGAWVGEARL